MAITCIAPKRTTYMTQVRTDRRRSKGVSWDTRHREPVQIDIVIPCMYVCLYVQDSTLRTFEPGRPKNQTWNATAPSQKVSHTAEIRQQMIHAILMLIAWQRKADGYSGKTATMNSPQTETECGAEHKV